MLVTNLEDTLRRLVRQRIDAGELTGSSLARDAGFRQAHISNFLNHRRGLSVEGFDAILRAMQISVYDLVSAHKPGHSNGTAFREYEDVPLVSALDASAQPVFAQRHLIDVLKFKKSFLRRLQPDMHGTRRSWHRFVIVKADADAGFAMYPRILPGATLLVDRHYNGLDPYRRREANLYLVRKGNVCLVRFVELHGRQLLLRPSNPEAALDYVAVESPRSAPEVIVGRICHVGMEV